MENCASGCVYVVDDEPRVLNVLRKTLERAGLTARCFSGADDCLAGLEADSCDLLITDVKMPGERRRGAADRSKAASALAAGPCHHGVWGRTRCGQGAEGGGRRFHRKAARQRFVPGDGANPAGAERGWQRPAGPIAHQNGDEDSASRSGRQKQSGDRRRVASVVSHGGGSSPPRNAETACQERRGTASAGGPAASVRFHPCARGGTRRIAESWKCRTVVVMTRPLSRQGPEPSLWSRLMEVRS